MRANHPIQLRFQDKSFAKPGSEFGGSLLKSNPKVRRPLKTNLPIHLVLRAQKSGMRNPKVYGFIHKQIYKSAKKYGIKIYKYANVGNHLHLLFKLSKLKLWAAFIRELTSLIASRVRSQISPKKDLIKSPASKDLDLETMKTQESPSEKTQFWKFRPYTRIISGWRKAFTTLKNYIYLNRLEAEGHISRSQVKNLKDLQLLIEDS